MNEILETLARINRLQEEMTTEHGRLQLLVIQAQLEQDAGLENDSCFEVRKLLRLFDGVEGMDAHQIADLREKVADLVV
jgi:hypothetical protein